MLRFGARSFVTKASGAVTPNPIYAPPAIVPTATAVGASSAKPIPPKRKTVLKIGKARLGQRKHLVNKLKQVKANATRILDNKEPNKWREYRLGCSTVPDRLYSSDRGFSPALQFPALQFP